MTKSDQPTNNPTLREPGPASTICNVATVSDAAVIRLRPWGAWALFVASTVAIGCASQPEYTTDEDQGSTHALIEIQRSRTIASREATDEQAVRAEALAGFMQVPAELDVGSARALMGLELGLPEMGQCVTRALGRDVDQPVATEERLELLDVGDVSLVADGRSTTLAPRAFPTVTDLISGVVYTTRDLSAEPLPAGVQYAVRTAGGAVSAVDLVGDAPRELAGVTVGGVPLAEVTRISPAAPIDLTWTVGDAGDVVYVELSADGTDPAVCAFQDDYGVGSIPAGAFAGSGPGRMSVHRFRGREFASDDIESGELRFDFELAASVTYGS